MKNSDARKILEAIDEHSYNELEDFGEISTIALPDDNFAMSNDEVETEEQEKFSEAECDDKVKETKVDEMKLA